MEVYRQRAWGEDCGRYASAERSEETDRRQGKLMRRNQRLQCSDILSFGGFSFGEMMMEGGGRGLV